MSTPNASYEDTLFSDLFLDEPVGGATPAQPAAAAPAAAPAETNPAPAPAQPEFFLESPSGSKYRTKEDVVNGITEKDRTIEQLRQFAMERTGVDPLKPVVVPKKNTTYLEDPSAYTTALQDAYKSNDPKAYFEAQNRLVQENLQQTLAPVQPLIQRLIKQEAMDAVVDKMKDFREFYSSADYQQVLKDHGVLAQAIQTAESNIVFKDQLPELYKLARLASQANKNEAVVAASQAATPQPQATRPTATSATPNPPTPTQSTTDWKTDPEARRAFLKQGMDKGLMNVNIGNVVPSR